MNKWVFIEYCTWLMAKLEWQSWILQFNNLTFKHENIVQIITLTGDNKIKTVYTGTAGVLLLMKINRTLKMTHNVIYSLT